MIWKRCWKFCKLLAHPNDISCSDATVAILIMQQLLEIRQVRSTPTVQRSSGLVMQCYAKARFLVDYRHTPRALISCNACYFACKTARKKQVNCNHFAPRCFEHVRTTVFVTCFWQVAEDVALRDVLEIRTFSRLLRVLLQADGFSLPWYFLVKIRDPCWNLIQDGWTWPSFNNTFFRNSMEFQFFGGISNFDFPTIGPSG